jgi:hypothetical protein
MQFVFIWALLELGHQTRSTFASITHERMEMDTNFMNRRLFADVATFHGGGITRGIEIPHDTYELHNALTTCHNCSTEE